MEKFGSTPWVNRTGQQKNATYSGTSDSDASDSLLSFPKGICCVELNVNSNRNKTRNLYESRQAFEVIYICYAPQTESLWERQSLGQRNGSTQRVSGSGYQKGSTYLIFRYILCSLYWKVCTPQLLA